MALDNDSVLHDHCSPVVLPVATATLNSLIRSRGLSAREMCTQRDQFSNFQIPPSDYDLISQQKKLRKANHPSGEKSKYPPPPPPRPKWSVAPQSPLVTWCISIVTETNLVGEIAT